jgi:DNA replication protein DnaC
VTSKRSNGICCRPVSRIASRWTASTGPRRFNLTVVNSSTCSRWSSWRARSIASFVGPVGVGKTLLAQCLGAAAVRAGHAVVFIRADALLAELSQARADRTYDKVFRRYLTPDLVILDDFGLRRLNAQQSNDLCELIVERHRRASFCITSNRSVDEWLALFDDPILGNSALDRLANAAHQVVIEGPSYRAKLAPKHRVTDNGVVREEVVPTP